MSRITKFSLIMLAGLFFIVLSGGHNLVIGREAADTLATKIRITNSDGEAVIVLYDNTASRDFALLLPMSVMFSDYVGKEKIAELPRKLTTAGGLPASEVEGDFSYFAPWGNLAVFYKGFGKGSGLYSLGRIESGKEWLAGQQEDFAARIERVEQP